MDFVVGDLLTIEGEKYITLEELVYENNQYIFVNKVTSEEEITDDYYIFKIVDDGIKIVVEENLKNILIPKFQKKLEQDLRDLS